MKISTIIPSISHFTVPFVSRKAFLAIKLCHGLSMISILGQRDRSKVGQQRLEFQVTQNHVLYVSQIWISWTSSWTMTHKGSPQVIAPAILLSKCFSCISNHNCKVKVKIPDDFRYSDITVSQISHNSVSPIRFHCPEGRRAVVLLMYCCCLLLFTISSSHETFSILLPKVIYLKHSDILTLEDNHKLQ